MSVCAACCVARHQTGPAPRGPADRVLCVQGEQASTAGSQLVFRASPLSWGLVRSAQLSRQLAAHVGHARAAPVPVRCARPHTPQTERGRRGRDARRAGAGARASAPLFIHTISDAPTRMQVSQSRTQSMSIRYLHTTHVWSRLAAALKYLLNSIYGSSRFIVV